MAITVVDVSEEPVMPYQAFSLDINERFAMRNTPPLQGLRERYGCWICAGES